MLGRHKLHGTLRLLLTSVVLAAGSGCVVLNAGPAPGQTLTFREPDTRRSCKLYVPSNYTPEQAWPVLVACHGARLFDSPQFQIDEWKSTAEAKGFLVLAPDLNSVGGDLGGDPTRQIDRQRQDEEAILACLAYVRAGRTIDRDRVFISGWLGGAYPALFTGLRNPDVFRAITLCQPAFDRRYIDPVAGYVDPWQPVQVIYGLYDIWRDPSLACIAWLREQQIVVTELESNRAGQRDASDAFQFIRSVVRTKPWLRVNVTEVDTASLLAVRFALRSSEPITAYKWEFGDGQEDATASPSHEYAQAGVYTVRVTVRIGKDSHVRQFDLRVPRVRVGATTEPAR